MRFFIRFARLAGFVLWLALAFAGIFAYFAFHSVQPGMGPVLGGLALGCMYVAFWSAVAWGLGWIFGYLFRPSRDY